MMALLKIAALLLVAIMALASSAEARALLDYDGCYNRTLFDSSCTSCYLTLRVCVMSFRMWCVYKISKAPTSSFSDRPIGSLREGSCA